METPVFDELSARARLSGARALDPEIPVAVDCEPLTYQQLSGEWHDQDTARDLDEALRQRELARAAQAQAIEMTAAAPRQELAQLVRGTVVEFAVQPGSQAVPRHAGRKVLLATRRVRGYLLGIPAAAPAQTPYVCQDDMPTELIPVIREVLVT